MYLVNKVRQQRKKYFDDRKKIVEDYKKGKSEKVHIPKFDGIIKIIEQRAIDGDGYVTLKGYNYQLIIDALNSEGFQTEIVYGTDLIVKWNMGRSKFSSIEIDFDFNQ